jgi:RND family efflux transporter MFP subunit
MLIVLSASAACTRSTPSAPAPEQAEALSVTRWTDKTELFAEYPPLVVGETSRFAIHLTRLDTFKALTEGRVEVRLEGGAVDAESFATSAPSRPGIFGVDVRPVRSGHRRLVIVLTSPALSDQHRVEDVDVFPTAEAARSVPAAEEGAPGISFLKEQQWTLEFGTAVVTQQSVRESVAIPARIAARAGGSAELVSPIDGRLSFVLDTPLGGRVSKGQELARVSPLPPSPGDLPQLERARSEAQSAVAFAARDRERAERLTTAGAAPAKRLDEARTAEEQARSRLTAAEASIAQFNAARAGNASSPGSAFVVRAPITGVLAARDATSGANVRAGAALFTIVDAARVQIAGQAPEAYASRVRAVQHAEIEIPGEPERMAAGPLLSLGRVLDPESRTLPVLFAFDNTTAALPVGQAVVLHLLMGASTPAPAVPASAIVDDAGRPIVFVQREGETFERRAVTLGSRAGDLVQVVEGVEPGERVVSKGAYLVRLASLSTSAPAHGHVH